MTLEPSKSGLRRDLPCSRCGGPNGLTGVLVLHPGSTSVSAAADGLPEGDIGVTRVRNLQAINLDVFEWRKLLI